MIYMIIKKSSDIFLKFCHYLNCYKTVVQLINVTRKLTVIGRTIEL